MAEIRVVVIKWISKDEKELKKKQKKKFVFELINALGAFIPLNNISKN